MATPLAKPISHRCFPLVACAGGAPLVFAASCSPPLPAGATDPNAPKGEVITAEAIAEANASTAWEALRRTFRRVTYVTDAGGRPAAIRARGRSSLRFNDGMLVYVDEMLLSDISILAQMPASTIERIVIMSGIEATTYFGTNAGDGVIHIITKGR